MLAAALAACHPSGPGGTLGPDAGWVGTWAPHAADRARQHAAGAGAGGQHAAAGGARLRGRRPAAGEVLQRVRHRAHDAGRGDVAASAGGGAIDPATDWALTFGGSPSVTLPPGGTAVSDPFAFPLRPLSGVAITLRFGGVPADLTGHPGSAPRRTSGRATPSPPPTCPGPFDRPLVRRHRHRRGGRGRRRGGDAGQLHHRRARLRDQPQQPLAGRAGAPPPGRPADGARRGAEPGDRRNCVLRACLGPAAVERFDRDVLGQSGVRWLVVLEGVKTSARRRARTARRRWRAA